jgi:Ran GTPase-activating protein (RanGAP) involved in mRNA processing and transport
MSTSFKSLKTDIEYLSKTLKVYSNELSFAGKGLKLNTKEDVKDICDEIAKVENLQVLRLEGNTISPQAAEELGKVLANHPEFERFIGNDIFTGRLKDEIPLSLKSICGSFDISGCKLVEINMSDNAFGPIGLEALVQFFESGCCFSLKEIRMHNNGLGPQGAQKLAAALDKCLEKSGTTRPLALKTFICGRNRLEFEGAKSISNTLKMIGTLEEIQMPQNGIRPNAIEFLADACASNPNLKIINFNDNTFRKVGAEWMAKALDKLNNLEYINFGDCLIKSSGSVLVARALVKSKNLKEVILSFNEISLTAGLEIANLMLRNRDTLKCIDLNGNKFGAEGRLEIVSVFAPVPQSLATLSEDEGSDEEEGEDEEDAYDEDSDDQEEEVEDEDGEEEEEEIEVGDDYDQVDDEYDDYDDGEDDDEEEYDDEENDDEQEGRYGSSNIVQPEAPSLFSKFKAPTTAQPGASAATNLFTSLINNSYLLLSVQSFDAFITVPTIENLNALSPAILDQVLAHQKFTGAYLIRFIAHLSKLYDTQQQQRAVLDTAGYLIKAFTQKIGTDHLTTFADEILTEFGFLKSEEKKFRHLDLSKSCNLLLHDISKQSYFPESVKKYITNFLSLRNKTMPQAMFNAQFKEKSDTFIRCFS